jgi:hypothetical protein
LCVAFSPDATQLLVGGGTMRLAPRTFQAFPNEQVRLYRLVEALPTKAP